MRRRGEMAPALVASERVEVGKCGVGYGSPMSGASVASPGGSRKRRSAGGSAARSACVLQFGFEPAALQIAIKGVGDEKRVFGPPRLGPGSQDGILERARPERLEARVDAGHVGVQNGAVVLSQARKHVGGVRAEPVRTQRAVGRDEARAEQSRQLARTGAAQQVHLEKPLLRVDDAQRPRRVEAALRHDPHDAQRVALDRDGLCQTGKCLVPSRRGRLARTNSHAEAPATMRSRTRTAARRRRRVTGGEERVAGT